MSQPDLDSWCEERGEDPIDLTQCSPQPAILRNYSLVFDYYSGTRKGGAANVEPKEGEHVEGVLLQLSLSQLALIDHKEGSPTCYYPIKVPVVLRDGSIQEAVRTYTVNDELKSSTFEPPTEAYLKVVVEGGKALGAFGSVD